MSNIAVEVAFAMPDRQWLKKLEASTADTPLDVVASCGLHEAFPELDFSSCVVGIWGHVVDGTAPLRDGDRIEIYRPVEVDPPAHRALAQSGWHHRSRQRACTPPPLRTVVRRPQATRGTARHRGRS